MKTTFDNAIPSVIPLLMILARNVIRDLMIVHSDDSKEITTRKEI
jgi:hypothetical protein